MPEDLGPQLTTRWTATIEPILRSRPLNALEMGKRNQSMPCVIRDPAWITPSGRTDSPIRNSLTDSFSAFAWLKGHRLLPMAQVTRLRVLACGHPVTRRNSTGTPTRVKLLYG